MKTEYINVKTAKTLTNIFKQRVSKTPNKVAYNQYNYSLAQWNSVTWKEIEQDAIAWQYYLLDRSAKDTVAIMVPNCIDWVAFDQAALGLNLITVPLYCNDNCENINYILKDANVKMLFLDTWEQYQSLTKILDYDGLEQIVIRHGIPNDSNLSSSIEVRSLDDIKREYVDSNEQNPFMSVAKPTNIASIVYTSGTTGKPKGVMLSHNNILWNAGAALQQIEVYPNDHALSFLPLSHMLERTAGYYLQIIAGSMISFARSVQDLPEDLLTQNPTILVAVPRIFERVYNKISDSIQENLITKWLFNKTVEIGWERYQYKQKKCNWKISFVLGLILDKIVATTVRNKLGDRLRFSIVGGAAMNAEVSKTFIGLGVPIIQGYGLTETSPVISVNPLENNVIQSVGVPLPDVQVKIADNDELIVKSPGIMQGYFNNPTATTDIIKDGWLHTGDKAKIIDDHIYITGRIKEIIVLSNGEKLPPNDMEQAICLDKHIEQCMIIGEGKPYLSALVVLANGWRIDELTMLDIIKYRLTEFPGYAKVRQIHIIPNTEMWSVDNECLTPTLKLKRHNITKLYKREIEYMYEGH